MMVTVATRNVGDIVYLPKAWHRDAGTGPWRVMEIRFRGVSVQNQHSGTRRFLYNDQIVEVRK